MQSSIHTFLTTTLLAATLVMFGCSDDETTNPKQARIHKATSMAYIEQGQYRAAIIEARNVIKYSPDTADGYLLLADIYNRLGNGSSALSVLETAQEQFVEETRMPLAEAYILSRKYSSGLKTLEQADEKNSTEWQLLKGKALAGMKEFSEAKDIFENILADKPDSIDAQLSLVNIDLANRQNDKAMNRLKQLLKQSPNNPEALFLKAQASFLQNNLDTTERLLTEALQNLPDTDILTPLKAKILQQLSETLTQLGRPSEGLIYAKLLAEANPEAHQAKLQFNQALDLYQTGQLKEAEQLLMSLYEQYPNNSMSGMLLGMINYQQGDLTTAESLLSDNLDVETSSPAVISSTALSQLRLRQPEKAVALIEEALTVRPEDASLNAIYGLALLNINAEDEKGAMAIQKALAIDPQRARLHTALARHYQALGKTEQAYAQLKTALNKLPADIGIQRDYLRALLSNKEFEKAELLASDMIANNPDNSTTHLLAVSASLANKNTPQARERLNKSILLDSNNRLALLTKGQMDLAEKRWIDAEKAYRAAIKLDNSDAKAYKGLITAYEVRGSNQREVIIDEMVKNASNEKQNATLLSVLAEYFARKKQYDKAEIYADQASTITPMQDYTRTVAISIYRNIAIQNLQEKNIAEARGKIFKALEIVPENPRLLTDLVAIEVAAKSYDEASRIATQLKESNPALADFLSGQIFFAQKQWQAAEKSYRQSWEANPTNTTASRLYSTLRNNNQDTAAFLSEWTLKVPQSAEPLSIKAIGYQRNNQIQEAIDLYERSLELAPRNSLVLNNLAWLYFETGNPKAIELGKRAYDIAPNNAGILDTYGWILVNQGETTKGIEILKKANQLAPDNKEIAEHLAAAQAM